jgi:hypothetical protein
MKELRCEFVLRFLLAVGFILGSMAILGPIGCGENEEYNLVEYVYWDCTGTYKCNEWDTTASQPAGGICAPRLNMPQAIRECESYFGSILESSCRQGWYVDCSCTATSASCYYRE